MADRYQDRPFPAANEFDRGGGSRASAKAEGDPLAELARLIGQTDPFGSMSRANLPLQPRAKQQPDQYDRNEGYELPEEPEIDEDPPPGPPSWIQRARQETPPQTEQDHPGTAYPLHHYAAEPAPEQYYDEEQQYVDPDQERDLSRYDEALYGGLDTGAHDNQHDQTYADDAYTYEDEYGDGEQEPKRQICATNLAFGGDGRDLYVSACDAVYKIRLETPGVISGPNGSGTMTSVVK